MSSIYHKTCPACADTVPREAERCNCGYDFSTATVVEDNDAASVHDEELYLNYLDARVDQLTAELETAREALAARPSSFERALVVMRILSKVRTAHDDVDVQAQRIRALKGEGLPTSANDSSSDEAAQPSAQDTGVFGAQTLDSVRAHEPNAAFRALQATRAAQAVSARTRECPNCHAMNPVAATHCGCGFELDPATLPDVQSGQPADETRTRR
jgi:hypothetical protein